MEDMVIDAERWRGRRVLVTGHTGFKGGWLALWLQRLGAAVTGYALDAPTSPSLFETARVGVGMKSITADVTDRAAVERAFAESRPEIVFHLAAQSLVQPSFDDPLGTYATNVMGTANVLEAARRSAGLKALIVVTSDKCYDNREWLWGYREDDPLGGHDPYSSSKGCAELVTAAYRTSFFAARGDAAVAVASVRAGNVIGGGDWAVARLVPDCIRAFLRHDRVSLRNPEAVRPWQHVLEPLAGYLILAERLLGESGARFAEAWNFGPDASDDAPVSAVATRLASLWGDAGEGVWNPTISPNAEAKTLRLDSTKARLRLGWRPCWGLDRALRETVSWYRAWAAGEHMQQRCLEQIARYERELVEPEAPR